YRGQWIHRIKTRSQVAPARRRSTCRISPLWCQFCYGQGLAEVLKGASMVVDVSNAPSWEHSAVLNFFETSTRNLLKYGAEAGIKHFVALSVVGTQRLSESGYFRAKIAQEKLIKNATIPYSIVQATQFFEFLKGIAHFSMQGDKVHLPPVLFQPMA